MKLYPKNDAIIIVQNIVDELEESNPLSAYRLLDLLNLCLDIIDDPQVIERVFDVSISLLKECWSNPGTWKPLFESFINLAFNPFILIHQKYYEYSFKVFKTLLEWGSTRINVLNLPVQKCIDFWKSGLNTDSRVITSMTNYIDCIAEMCIYGPLRESDQLDLKHEALVSLKLELPSLNQDQIKQSQKYFSFFI
jgi:hypothetical protein